MEITKFKKEKKSLKCLLDLLSPPLPLEKARVDFCSPSVELQFLNSVTQYTIPFQQRWLLWLSSPAFCLL